MELLQQHLCTQERHPPATTGCELQKNIDVLAGLQAQIIAEDRLIERKIVDVVGEWDSEQPINDDIKADTALNSLAIF
jgi:hypothetical protein